MIRFEPGDLVKEDTSFGIILQAGPVAYDVLWVGGGTRRYRYATGREVHVLTERQIREDVGEITVRHLRTEVTNARRERREGLGRKRGHVSPRR